jgi:ABC-2 type transport system ATP-binding protein|nr:MAG: multidrug ABC transporter ATP-binding protein [Pseudomonadota bacterium]
MEIQPFRLAVAACRQRRMRAVQQPILTIENLSKTYPGGLAALSDVNLAIRQGEIFALLGPNGAGKTTLIGIVCGLVNMSSGRVVVAGHDIARDTRAARRAVGLVPQELATEAFETVQAAVAFSRGLFGHAPDPARVEKVLRSLSLWDKRGTKIMALSGGMKRRVMIAKALVHEPKLLFLDEPTAGVDVELRRDMWQLVRELRDDGVTIILTTHYIEEAEEMADRIGIINKGRLVLVDEKTRLMQRLGRKDLRLHLMEKLDAVPPRLAAWKLALSEDGMTLVFTFSNEAERGRIALLLREVAACGIEFRDLETQQSSLEDIFVSTLKGAA